MLLVLIAKSSQLTNMKTENPSTSHAHIVILKLFYSYLIPLDIEILKRKFLHRNREIKYLKAYNWGRQLTLF